MKSFVLLLSLLVLASGQARAARPQRGALAHGARPAAPHRAPPPLKRYAPVALLAPSHRERLLLQPFDDHGRPRQRARRELSHLLRCPHTAKERAADPRLLPVLYQTGRHFRKPLVISSGYRPPELTTVKRSRHLNAAAVDFYMPGVRNEDLVRWLRQSFHPIGVGYYPNGGHVHLDVDRQRDAFWVQRGSDRLPLWRRLAARRPRS